MAVTVVGLSLRPLTVTERRDALLLRFKTMLREKERPVGPTARPDRAVTQRLPCHSRVGMLSWSAGRRRPGVFCIYSPSNEDSKRSDPSVLWSSVAIGAQIPSDKWIEMVLLENFG